MSTQRDFRFTEQDFRCIQQLVNTRTGIALSDAKRDMVYSRLSRRLRARQFSDFSSYCMLLESGSDEQELIEFVNAITTNLTSFFRENHHFEHLESVLLPQLLKSNAANRRLRVWSAGCSTGEEPYSIAIVVRENVPRDWDVKILATDLDSNVLKTAAAGVYAYERVEGLDQRRLKNWFRRGTGVNKGKVKVNDDLRSLVVFKQLNLMEGWPIRGPLDVIFCRNVVIYFDKETQSRLFDRYADLLRLDGHLFVGHSESLYRVTDRFKLLRQTIYQRVK